MHFFRLPFNDQLNPQVTQSDSRILSTLQVQESPSDPEGISTEFLSSLTIPFDRMPARSVSDIVTRIL
jgi:hypothetical protein